MLSAKFCSILADPKQQWDAFWALRRDPRIMAEPRRKTQTSSTTRPLAPARSRPSTRELRASQPASSSLTARHPVSRAITGMPPTDIPASTSRRSRMVERVQMVGIWVSERAGCYRRSRPHEPICDGTHTSIDTRAGPVLGVPEPPRREPAADRHRSRLPLAAVAAPAPGPRRAALVNRSELSPLAALLSTDKLAGGIAAARARERAWPGGVYSTARVCPGRLRAVAGRRAWIVRRRPTARRDRSGGDRPAATLRIARDSVARTQRPRVRAQTA